MESVTTKDNVIVITEEIIQTEAENAIDRRLSPAEYEEVYEVIMEDLYLLLQDSVHKVTCYHKMLERNKEAEKTFPHYVAYHRNINAYQNDFSKLGVFGSEADARSFMNYDLVTQYDEWKLVQVNKDGSEQEIYRLNC
jgi:hypothetical protein